MRRENILKRIIENEEFREKYWPEFPIDKDIFDYGTLIGNGKSKNPYLLSLKSVIYDESETDRNMKRQLEKFFDL